MKRLALPIVALTLFLALPSRAGLFDDIVRGVVRTPKGGPEDDRVVAGLKEALSIGTGNAVASVSRQDGYFGNRDIRIPVPDKLRKTSDLLRRFGFEKEVDDFVLSMNRAAEKAAPKAKAIFVDAVREMTFDDARRILDGGDTAATDFFRKKTFDRLSGAFRPDVSSAMDNVGVTRSYKRLTAKVASLPLARSESIDLDGYVTNKALDGLFRMVAQEERKIRTDPAARVTELLKSVFGRK